MVEKRKSSSESRIEKSLEAVQRWQEGINEDISVLAKKVDRLLSRVEDNNDTSEEQVEEYLNKIGRMIASRKFEGAASFLQSVFDRTDATRHITKKQMRAVDRIYDRGPGLAQINSNHAYAGIDDDPFWDDF